MSFYIGNYLIEEGTLSPRHDAESWAFPDDKEQHMSDTSNVEELHIKVTDMGVLPEDIQSGCEEWTEVDTETGEWNGNGE